ncbi:MAG: DUF4833 domain-containing protein [Chitinispirillaceae bacterium]|nr:DUF4833 domain-containing protein [Chitinispirillaceae bacterium]
MRVNIIVLCPVLFALAFPFLSRAASVPASTQPLFYIERSKNANEVHYVALLTKSGELDIRNPVRAFWINWALDSTGKNRAELNFVQKQMAFGFSIGRSPDTRSCTMKIVCCKDRPIKVYLHEGTARAETAINATAAYLKKITVVTRGKQLIPRVISVTVTGTAVATGEEISETIAPD